MNKILVILLFSVVSLFAFEELTADNFDQKISGKNVIVEFHQVWWPACKALGKSLTKYNASKKPDITIYKVDLGKEAALGKKLNIFSFPALLYIKNGKVIAREDGKRSPEELEASVIKYLQ